MKRCYCLLVVCALMFGPDRPGWAAGPEVLEILEQTGRPAGIYVLLGDEDAAVARQLADAFENLTLYVQVPDQAGAEAARKAVFEAGLYGKRVYVSRGPLSRIHLASNLADAVVALGEVRAPRDEMLRVLCPGGKLLAGGQVRQKPFPEGIDTWPYPYHGADNNPVSRDQRAVGRFRSQFFALPHNAPAPTMGVAAGGRVFRVYGHFTNRRFEWPWIWKLQALSGYNGTQLWTADLPEGFLVHRNTLIATEDRVYLGDTQGCRVFDAATGTVLDRIAPNENIAGGKAWKWMALEDGVLFALLGGDEPNVELPVQRDARGGGGWGRGSLGHSFSMPSKWVWGFGKTLMAIDPGTRTILWHKSFDDPVDGRGLAFRDGRIYLHVHKRFLACIDAGTGSFVWKNDSPELLERIGEYLGDKAYYGSYDFYSVPYLRCCEKVVGLAGPQFAPTVVVSAEDGRLLWSLPQYHRLLFWRQELLAVRGSWSILDPLTGKRTRLVRTRPVRGCNCLTASVDRLLNRQTRGGTGTTALEDLTFHDFTPMRPSCTNGVMVAHGNLYWGPWICGCNYSLNGNLCVSPADDPPPPTEPLEKSDLYGARPAAFPVDEKDWPAYRKDNVRSAGTTVPVGAKVAEVWTADLGAEPAAPVVVGRTAFLAGRDGVVRALNVDDGSIRWTAFTEGQIIFPPAVADGRLFVGSADGWIYALEAASGKLLWRFRVAPWERRIPVFGRLSSTWPAAAGVLVEPATDGAPGVVYAAAGIANYDGTYVVALDPATGAVKWKNDTSHLATTINFQGTGTGVSVQGHLLLDKGVLYFPGGNAITVAAYNAKDGTFIQEPPHLYHPSNKDWSRKMVQGRELFLVGDEPRPDMDLLYFRMGTRGFFHKRKRVRAFSDEKVVVWNSAVDDRQDAWEPMAFECFSREHFGEEMEAKPLWSAKSFNMPRALAVTANAFLVAGEQRRPMKESTFGIAAFDLAGGARLWEFPLETDPVNFGIAVDRQGRILLALKDGRLICYK
jgi:outer membrane protein assembly factor BamB